MVMGAARQPCESFSSASRKKDSSHLQTCRLSLIVEQLYQQKPLTHLQNCRARPLNLNIRSLWFEALGCSAPGVDLKGEHGSCVAVCHRNITPPGENLFVPR